MKLIGIRCLLQFQNMVLNAVLVECDLM